MGIASSAYAFRGQFFCCSIHGGAEPAILGPVRGGATQQDPRISARMVLMTSLPQRIVSHLFYCSSIQQMSPPLGLHRGFLQCPLFLLIQILPFFEEPHPYPLGDILQVSATQTRLSLQVRIFILQ